MCQDASTVKWLEALIKVIDTSSRRRHLKYLSSHVLDVHDTVWTLHHQWAELASEVN